MGFNLRRMFTPPSSWNSFTRGTLAPIIREGATGLGFLIGGPGGAAAGRTLGDLGARAAAGDNLERENLGSLGGRAIGQAATGYAMGTGARMLGNAGSAFNAARAGGQGVGSSLKSAFMGGNPSVNIRGMPVDALDPSAGTFTASVGNPSVQGMGGSVADAFGGAGRFVRDNPLVVSQIGAGALSAMAQGDAADVARERLDLERAQIEEDLARRKRLREQYQPLRDDILRRLFAGGGA